ncbi:MAG: di-trans,poly-cis-decaprenylcistransferase [Gammaproteobacteria bacterium]|nr:di-trans,poly-cis-decaprenylcistransferase [Gammaproteobacteria bacterium]MYJ52598.1 di-trans,poly-cis-decaprenylcistransferase [Gammaproteobacteria bacterium]
MEGGSVSPGSGICRQDHAGGTLPEHVAVIMDGNGRWAMQRGLPRTAGHKVGVDAARELVKSCRKRGISYLTLFAFSSENWRRPAEEVRVLLDLLGSSLENETRLLDENDIRLMVIGDVPRFPKLLQRSIEKTCRRTRNNRSMTLTIALNYGGQWDILNACRSIAESIQDGEIAVSEVTRNLVESRLCTRDLPDPDLFIRTGGEIRISNFLLWQLAYTELYFTDTYWPDFDIDCFERALKVFADRQRRFGNVEQQIEECA